MKKYILLLLCLTAVSPIYAQVFAEYFADKTLRADYIFSGNALDDFQISRCNRRRTGNQYLVNNGIVDLPAGFSHKLFPNA